MAFPVKWNLANIHTLPPRRRWAVLTAAALAGIALLAIDRYVSAIQLRPVVFVLLVLASAFGGLWFGIGYAVLAAASFTFVEWLADGKTIDAALFVNAAIAAVSSSFIPLIVWYVAQRARDMADLEARLRQAELDRQQLVESEAVRTALLRTEASYRAVGESIPFGIWQTDAAGRLQYVSDSFLELTGMTLEQLADDNGWLARVPPADAKHFLQRWSERDSAGDVWEGEYRLHGVDGRLYTILSRGVRIKDERGITTGWSGMSLDITDRKRATDAVALLEDVGRQLTLSLDPNTILDRVATVCTARFADWVAIDIVQEDGSLRSAVVKHASPKKLESVVELRAYPRNTDEKRGPNAVARTGKS
ncbi:MAG TPA: PAS domain-containing protein, partial [Candidatus Eremiobacteraceae bacterium]|nr:PAS domain-containing protein [Candidatus Eremiobacteraceae bacterium]